jgi:uncharacterized membrane protein YqjE
MTGKAYIALAILVAVIVTLSVLTIYAAWNHNFLAAVPLSILVFMSIKLVIR